MRRFLAMTFAAILAAGAAFAGVKVTGAAASIGDLAGTPTLVTVVLKGGAKDTNLIVGAVNAATISFTTEKGETAIYSVDSIDEIQVQGGTVEKKVVIERGPVLAASDQQIVNRAFARAKEIFDSATQEQNIKIQVAGLLALNKDEEAQKYLEQLANAGELQTSLDACKALYLAGLPVPETILRQGLASGNRLVRGAAAELSGITQYKEADSILVRLAQDRSWEISGPACRAVARLGNREIVPALISELNERNDEKAAAVMWSLIRLGGKDIAEQLKLHLAQTSGIEKYRTVYVLYRLGEYPDSKRLYLDVMEEMPTLALKAAVILGADGDVSAMDTLRQHLRRREDETEPNLINRAAAATALIMGGDPAPKGVLQELMRSSKKNVRNATFGFIVRLNNRTMLSLMQSSIENVDNATAAEAATTAIALGSSDFRDRLIDLRATDEAALAGKKKK
nr:hypothetical protein [uncultured bacterium]